MKRVKKLGVLIIAGVISISMLVGCSNNSENNNEGAKGKPKVTLAYANWSNCVAVTKVAKVALEEKMGYEVEDIMSEAAVVYTSVADGDTDFFLDMWLPTTHKNYYDEYKDDIVELGATYEDAKIGIVVPEYVDIDSIDELNDHKDKFDGQIVGIDSGAGVMQAAEEAIEDYDLDFELMTGSEPVMTAAISDALDNESWIAVPGWTPHWIFSRWDMKFLEDPKDTYGDDETAYAIGRIGVHEDMPEVTEFIENFLMDVDDVGEIMGKIDEEDDPEEVAREWIKENEEKVDSWIPKK